MGSFFLYEASADPTDFEEEVDYDYQRALVRAQVNNDRYTNNKRVVPALEDWIAESFDGDGVTATVTGRVTVNYFWINGIDRSNLISILASFAAVTAMAMMVFRSVLAGAIAATPVGLAVLCVYSVMGYLSIPLGVGTSMFAAIAIGLSIDFAIHALDKIREIVREVGFSPDAMLELYPSTGRALLFNLIAVAGGWSSYNVGCAAVDQVWFACRCGGLRGLPGLNDCPARAGVRVETIRRHENERTGEI